MAARRKLTIVGINYAPEPTGISVYTTGLAEALADTDEVSVLTGVPHYPQWHIYDGYDVSRSRRRINGVSVTRLRHWVPAQPKLVNRVAMEIQYGLRTMFSRWDRPDVALLVSPALVSSGIAAMKARATRTPTCIWVQDIYSLGVAETAAAGGLLCRAVRTVERRILGSAASVVVIHERFKRYLVDDLGLDAAKVHVIRNWAHVDDSRSSDRDDVRRSMGWADDDVVVLHAGNMGAKQGLDNVVHAARLAEQSGSVVRFVLMGDGNQRSALEALGAGSRLDFVDPVDADRFMPVLGAADVLLVNERPGLTEMCVPSKLTSYFSTGLPVLAATDAASVTAEEIALSGAGLRVDSADPAALLSAAESLGADRSRAETLGEAGRRFRAQNLTAESAVAAFRQILEAISPAPRIPLDDRTDVAPSRMTSA